jgi:hypothetical protein
MIGLCLAWCRVGVQGLDIDGDECFRRRYRGEAPRDNREEVRKEGVGGVSREGEKESDAGIDMA